jgi:hypothetical protein
MDHCILSFSPRKILLNLQKPLRRLGTDSFAGFVLCPLSFGLSPRPARARAARSLWGDDDVPPTRSSSAHRDDWVEGAPFPPLPNITCSGACRSGRGCRCAHAGRGFTPHRATHQRRATPAEHLFMLRRYDDENPQLHRRLDVMHTCIAAAYPDAVVSDVRYHSAMM